MLVVFLDALIKGIIIALLVFCFSVIKDLFTGTKK